MVLFDLLLYHFLGSLFLVVVLWKVDFSEL